MRSFNANAEQRLARQFLNEWHATTTTTNAKVSGETPTLKGLGRDLPLSINGDTIDTRPRCRQHRTITVPSNCRILLLGAERAIAAKSASELNR